MHNFNLKHFVFLDLWGSNILFFWIYGSETFFFSGFMPVKHFVFLDLWVSNVLFFWIYGVQTFFSGIYGAQTFLFFWIYGG